MKHKTKVSGNTALSILLLIVFVLLLSLSISLVRTKLLQNTQDLGMSLAQSYGAEEEMHIASFRNFLNLGAQYVEELSQEEENSQAIQNWLSSYFSKLTVLLGGHVVDPYAVINGQIIAANPWSGDEEHDYQSSGWYQQALNAQGEIIFTDVYIDTITGEPVITASKRLGNGNDVLAMDIYPLSFHENHSSMTLPENCSLYVCDSSGTAIYSVNQWNLSQQALQSYTDFLIEGIRDGSLFAYDASVTDPQGVKRGVYYYQMSNGWLVILTVPLESVLIGDRNMTIYALVAMAILLFAILASMVVRDLIQNQKIQRAGNTIQILGDSFYAIYRVNYRDGTYETIKNSQDLEEILSTGGSYPFLLSTIQERVEPSTYQEFGTCFSLDSIRQRVAEKIPDYGGDYQRRFGNMYKWVNIRTLYNGELAPDEVILCFREVDAEKRQQLQHTIILQEALDTARKSTQAKTIFFSSMSHDMRTPLNAIIGLSELAQKSEGNWEKIRDYMKKIEFSGRQLLTLINDILEVSRLESGKSTLDMKKFNLKCCLEDNGSLFREQAIAEQKDFSMEFDLENPMVLGDPFKLGQIFNNLLSNAFKYSEPGAKIHVLVRQFAFQQHSKYQITVEDTGIGMSQQFLEHLFDPYTRETHFATHSTVGTGLGMPIVKSLVQQMSGEISVESTLGKGSKFVVTLPLTAIIEESESAAPLESSTTPEFHLSGKHILLAEDNELNMEIATDMLVMNGMEVLPACNGQEAVQIFSASAPYAIDAILMDMQMPVMDGCQAAKAIRELDRPDAKTIPILAVTANAFAEDIAKTSEAGMNGHISKPIDFTLLLRKLEELLQK